MSQSELFLFITYPVCGILLLLATGNELIQSSMLTALENKPSVVAHAYNPSYLGVRQTTDKKLASPISTDNLGCVCL
jgi:hypothetical protein